MSKRKTRKQLEKVAVITESPDDCPRTWDAVRYIMEPLEKRYDVARISVLDTDPKNGKAATKTEIRNARDRVFEAIEGFKYVVIVGNTPLQLVTGKAGISKLRGKPIKQDGYFFLPMNNPGIIRHDDKQETLLNADLQFLDDMVQFGGIPETKELDFRIVMCDDDIDEMLEDLKGAVSYDIETTQLYPWQTQHLNIKTGEWVKNPDPKIVSIGFGTARHQWCIPVNHPQSPWTQAEVEEMLDEINECRNDFMLIAHNGKFDLLWTWVHLGVKWEVDFDTMLAHYLLDENMRHGLKYLAQVYCGAPDWEIDLTEKQGTNVPLKRHCKYLAHDLYYTRKLRYVFGKMLKDDLEVKRVFDKIMMPCANLFIEVEYDGVFVDIDQFDEAEEVLREQYETALAELKEWEPEYVIDAKGKEQPFNWGSPVQLAKLLFEDLGIKPLDRTAAGNPSTSESVIQRLDHPCTNALLRFRAAKQQLSFFIDGWKPFLHKQSRGYYLHPSFKLHGTVTGRLSCEHPNLQQVPRDPRIRSLISAEKGWTLIQCDLSQAELRIAAELARERNMIHAFNNGIDVHWLTAIREIARGGGLVEPVMVTAKKLNGSKLSYSDAIELLIKAGHEACIEVNGEWKEYRKKAKAVNFGYLYGMWWKKFKIYARDNYGVIISDEEAEASRVTFFDNYPDLEPWHKRQRKYVRRHGYVKSLSGRKRRLPEARSADDTPERRAAERQAINSPVQSFANEVNLMAAIQLRKEYGRDVVKICGTVHDSVLFRVRNDMVEEVYYRVLEIMRWPELMDEFDIEMSVPIEADGEIGPWGKGKPFNKWKEAA
jgi:DNA polymerase I-like protein with 3'-5' exonuclease and polymerase domains